MNLPEFIDTCKILLRDGYTEHVKINGVLVKSTIYEDEHVRIIKSMIDYTTIIFMRSINKNVITIDKDGYIDLVDCDWKILSKKIENKNRILAS